MATEEDNGDILNYKATLNRLENDICPVSADVALTSIAISTRRIADMLIAIDGKLADLGSASRIAGAQVGGLANHVSNLPGHINGMSSSLNGWASSLQQVLNKMHSEMRKE